MLKKFFDFIKKHGLFVIVTIGAVVAFLFRKRPSDFSDDVRKMNEIHDNELKKIEKINKETQDLKNKAIVEHDKNKAEIEREFSQKTNDLNASANADVERMKTVGEQDVVKLAEEVSQVTGFKVIMSKDD